MASDEPIEKPPSWRDRVSALRYVPPLIKLVWTTHRPLALAMFVLRLFRAFTPLATLWIGKLIIDAVVNSLKRPYFIAPGFFFLDAPPAWLKLFVYITDVGPDNGPHVYIRGSHKPGLSQTREFRARGYQRIEDDEIASEFGARSLIEITGKRGTVFMADTRGFHDLPRTDDGERRFVNGHPNR